MLLMLLSGLGTGHARSDGQRGQGGSHSSAYNKAGDWTLHTLDGREVSFSDYKGRTVFLNFWATWCKPCISEMESIQKLKSDMKDENIAFLLVTAEKEEKVRAFLKKHPLKLPIFCSGEGAPKMFKPDKFPYTLIIDEQGNVVFRRTGCMDWHKPAFRQLVKSFMPEG